MMTLNECSFCLDEMVEQADFCSTQCEIEYNLEFEPIILEKA